jgi:hypothetical protein
MADCSDNRPQDHGPCRKCLGVGGGYVRLGDDEWEWEPCVACCGAGDEPF